MIKNGESAFHLGLTHKDLQDVELVLLPGDPQRVPKIASHLDQAKQLANHREYNAMIGKHENKSILVISTGIGGPSTAIAVEELAMLGMKRFVRIGTSGAIQAHINPGDVVIPTGAVRLDGASRHIAPIEYPAVADFHLVQALRKSTLDSGSRHHLGICATSDTFYQGQNRKDSFKKGFITREYQNLIEELRQLNVLSFDMETSTLYTQAAAYGLQAACILGILVNRTTGERPDEKLIADIESRVIQSAIGAIKNLTE